MVGGIKRCVRRMVEVSAGAVSPLALRMRRRPGLLVLMYHRVLPSGHPDRRTEQPGMYVSPETLRMHLQVLRENRFEFVHLDEWLHGARKGQPLPALACAITFDDGWKDNYDHAWPVLKSERAPAIIYLVSSLVGTRYSFWPNSLARILSTVPAQSLPRLPDWLSSVVHACSVSAGRSVLDAQEIDAVICACKGRSDAEMLGIIEALQEDLPPASADRDLMSWAEIREMKAHGLVRFGSHTRRHTRMSGISSREAIEDEIMGSREEIARNLGDAPVTFCYPNGDTTTAAVDIARSAYAGAVTTVNGWHFPADDPFVIRRVGVHEDISNRPASFLARVAGWL